jgi:hypothetical protein
MAAVSSKRSSEAESPPLAKRQTSHSIGVTILEEDDVQFDYQGRMTKVSLIKLKEVSEYFEKFFSGNWQQKNQPGSKYELIKPDDDNFSPSLFMDLLHAKTDPQVALEINSMEAVFNAVNLIHFYGFKGQIKIKNSDFFIVTYGDIKRNAFDYDVTAQLIDRKRLAEQCCQVILDEPGFMDYCLFAPQARKFLSQETLRILRLFDKIRNEIVYLEIEILEAEKKEEVKKYPPDIQSKALHMAIPLTSLEQVLSLFPNLQELMLKSKDAEWDGSVKASYVIENHENNETIQMLINKFLHHFKQLRTVTIPVKNDPPIVLKFMNEKRYILEFNNDENICIYQRDSETNSYKFDFIIGYRNHFPQVDEALIRGLLSFPPTPELLEGIDPSRLPWTEDGKLRSGWGVHRPD